MRKAIIFSALLLTFSCATKQESDSKRCLNEDNVKKIKLGFEDIFRKTSGKEPQFKLVEENCSKRIYLDEDNGFIIAKKGEKATGVTFALNGKTLKERRESALNCLATAEKTAEKLDDSMVESVLERSRKVRPDLWFDSDLGHANWVNCNSIGSIDYYNSVNTFIHEINHSNDTGTNCLFHPLEKKEYCFDSKELPPLSTGRIKTLPVKHKGFAEFYNTIQNIYLDFKANNEISNILDEMVAYSITARVQGEMIRKLGTDAVYHSGTDKRSAMVLPMMMSMNLNYLLNIKKSSPKKFNQFYSGENKEVIEKLFELSEQEYSRWEVSLKSVGKRPKEAEAAMYRWYQQHKPKL